jgi:hypothetical protein
MLLSPTQIRMKNASSSTKLDQTNWADYVDHLYASALDQTLEKRRRQRSLASTDRSDSSAAGAPPMKLATQTEQH